MSKTLKETRHAHEPESFCEIPQTLAPNIRPELIPFVEEVLSQQSAILLERGRVYFDFADNTQAAVDILRALGFTFPSHFSDQTVGTLLHIACKLSRIPQSPVHRDNWLDLANYAALGLAMQDRVNSMEKLGES